MRIKNNNFLKIFIVGWFLLFGLLPFLASADNPPTTVLEPSEYTGNCSDCEVGDEKCKKYCGNYQVNDFLNLGVKITNIILGIVGALALLAFVAGGVMFLVSAGNNSLVERGKSTIIGAVIGLLVVFASYTIVSFTAKALGVKSEGIFNSSWFQK